MYIYIAAIHAFVYNAFREMKMELNFKVKNKATIKKSEFLCVFLPRKN